MIYPICHLPTVIPVGIQTEKGVCEVRFDMSPWLDKWPDMHFEVWPTRPGENEAYPAVSELDGDILTWHVGAVDTEKEGLGKVEIVGMTPDGERKKHAGPVDTAVKATSLSMTQDMPDAHVPYYEALLAANVDAKAVTGENAKAAQEATQEALQARNEASAWAQEAVQHSANADSKASDAAAHATNAAASEESAIKARDTAISQADDAEAFAKEAAASAKAAADNEHGAEVYADSALDCMNTARGHADSAAANAVEAATSAKEAKQAAAQSAQSAAERAQDLFIVRVTGGEASHSQSEIRAAVAEEKTCILVDTDGRVFPYFREENDQSYGNCLAFLAPLAYQPGTGILHVKKLVTSDGRVVGSGYSPAKTPNPFKLKLTGAVEAEYDGSSAVAVEIPAGGGGAGLPEAADPLKQLVTDADGNVAWEDRLAYKQTAQVENLAATALTFISDDDGYALTTPWAADVVAGAVCTVNYNGADYECKAIDLRVLQPDFPFDCCALGNFDAMGMTGIDGSNTDAPFVLLAVPNAIAVEVGAYANLFPMDGATTVTLSVSSADTAYKTIDPKYLPKQKQEALTFTGRTDATYDGSMPMSIEIPTALPNPKALTFTGATSATYNGNSALTVDIPKVPKPTTSDAGKFLRVNTSGAYALEAIANAEEASF